MGQAPNGKAHDIAKPTPPDWVSQLRADPHGFKPTEPCHLIGPAIAISKELLGLAQQLRAGKPGPRKILLHGPSGTGKTCIATMLSKVLTTQNINIAEYDGAKLNKDDVAGWVTSLQYCQTGIRVVLINEVNFCSQEAKHLFLSLFDRELENHVFIATTNTKPDNSAFWSRWVPNLVSPPTKKEIEVWLESVMNIPGVKARSIARTCGQNVRSAQTAAAKYVRP